MGQQPDVDKAFIERNIIDMQAEEVGQLGEYRKSWYGTQP